MDPELIDAAETLLLFSREAWRESLSRNVLPNTVKPVRSRIPPLRYRDEFIEAETSSRSGYRKRKAAATSSMAVDQSVSDEFKPVRSKVCPLHYRDEFEVTETSSRSGCRKRKAPAATSSIVVDQSISDDEFKRVRSKIRPLHYRDEFEVAETSSRSGCRKRKAAATSSMAVDQSISDDEFKPVRSKIRPLHYHDDQFEVAETSSRSGCRKRKAAATSSMAVDQNISDEVKLHQKKRKRAAIPVDNESGKKNIKNENLDHQGQKDMPEDLKSMIEAIGGTSVVLVIQKPLTATDVKDVQNRLQIPFSQVASHGFLTDEDNRFLGTRDRNGHPSYIKTTLLDPKLRSHVITFRKWTMRKDSGARTQVYAFNSPWIDIVMLNGLRPGDVVQVWAFRVGEQLQFALAKVDD